MDIRRQIKRGVKTGFLVGMIASLLTGCGGEYTGMGRGGAVSGAAVSGSAVSGAAVEEKGLEDEKTTKVEQNNYTSFRTDTNFYDYCYDELICRRLDGTHEEVIKIKNLEEILTVADGYLYYITTDEKKYDYIYRVSLQKDEDGYDKVAKETAELLVKEMYDEDEVAIYETYADSTCIFYINSEGDVVRFDLQTKKKKIVDKPVKGLDYKNCRFIGNGKHIVLEVENEGLFIWEAGEEKWLILTEHDVYDQDIVEWNGEDYFHCCDLEQEPDAVQEIFRVDLEKRTEETFVTQEQLQQAAKEAVGLNSEKQLELLGVVNLFWEGDRLYIQTQINWTKEDQYHIGYAMFSQGQKETELRYEKSLTECMREHGIVRKGKIQADNYYGMGSQTEIMREKIIYEDAIFYDAWSFAIVNGKVFMYCDGFEKWKKQCIGCYELSTGEFRKLTKQNPEYWEPYIFCYWGAMLFDLYDTNCYDAYISDLTYLCAKDKKYPYVHFVEKDGGEEG